MSERWLAWLRIGFGVLVLVAIVFMIGVLVDEGAFNPLNFFTFFTILSNLLGAAVFLEGGRRQLTGAAPVPNVWRGAASSDRLRRAPWTPDPSDGDRSYWCCRAYQYGRER
ncbi:MAG TPA: hypothetical protein VFW95_01650 [Candidatus Limnocylindria bacterium]|nr:hypothetical protein [Candidatus Limnocylindria bacterium]